MLVLLVGRPEANGGNPTAHESAAIVTAAANTRCRRADSITRLTRARPPQCAEMRTAHEIQNTRTYKALHSRARTLEG